LLDRISLGELVASLVRLLLTALLMISSVCYADTWLSVGGVSAHACHTCGYNNFNPGLGLQHDVKKDLRILGGVYYNSYYKATVYAGVGYQPLQYGMIRVGIMSGLVTNYDNLRVPVMALPALSIEGERVGIDILGFPNVGSRTGLITANLKFKL
jgi:hypothetical protein